jgi:hypothetical protein
MLMEAIADQIPTTDQDFPEVSIIMPCLNEADTQVQHRSVYFPA